VNFANAKAYLTLDESLITLEEIIKIIKDSGYDASVDDGTDTKKESERHKKEINSWRNKFVGSALLSIPLLAFMVYDFFPWLPFGRDIMPYMAIISLILASIIQFVIGRGFYRGLISSIRARMANMDTLIAIGT
jgi:Cu+-exporting ATPase